jgi:hypothetical protein
VVKIATFAKPENVIGKGPERFAEKIKIRFSWLFLRPASTEIFKFEEINHDFQRPDHHIA